MSISSESLEHSAAIIALIRVDLDIWKTPWWRILTHLQLRNKRAIMRKIYLEKYGSPYGYPHNE